jgi:hypothetical protein
MGKMQDIMRNIAHTNDRKEKEALQKKFGSLKQKLYVTRLRKLPFGQFSPSSPHIDIILFVYVEDNN